MQTVAEIETAITTMIESDFYQKVYSEYSRLLHVLGNAFDGEIVALVMIAHQHVQEQEPSCFKSDTTPKSHE